MSMEADVTIILKSFLFWRSSFNKPRITSMLMVLSWASSITKHEYFYNKGDYINSSNKNRSNLKIIFALGFTFLLIDAI